MRRLLIVLATLVLFAGAQSAFGDIPEIISYQGVVRDGVGNPVPDGTYDLTFRLYEDESGTALVWGEAQTIPVEDGLFSAYLGDEEPLGLPLEPH